MACYFIFIKVMDKNFSKYDGNLSYQLNFSLMSLSSEFV